MRLLLVLAVFFTVGNVVAADLTPAPECAKVMALLSSPATAPMPLPEPAELTSPPIETDSQALSQSLEDQHAERQEILQIIDRINKLDRQIQNYKASNAGHERITEQSQRRRLTRFQIFLHLGDAKSSVDMYRMIFRDLEQSYWEIKDVGIKLQKLAQSETDKEISPEAAARIQTDLLAEREKAYKIFGENYGEYMNVRFTLEKIIETKDYVDTNVVINLQKPKNFDVSPQEFGGTNMDPSDTAANKDSARQVYVETAAQTLKYLGIHSLHTLFPELGIEEARASIADLSAMFRTTWQINIYKLEADKKKEQRTFWKVVTLSAPVLDAVKKAVYTLPPPLRKPVSSVLGIGYDIHVRDRYLPDIEMVLRAPRDQRLEILRELNARSTKKDELLVTLIRVVSATSAWHQLKRDCERLKTRETIYREFYRRMLAAEKKALREGDLSMFYEQSLAERMGFVIAAGGVVAVWGITQHFAPAHDVVSDFHAVLDAINQLMQTVLATLR